MSDTIMHSVPVNMWRKVEDHGAVRLGVLAGEGVAVLIYGCAQSDITNPDELPGWYLCKWSERIEASDGEVIEVGRWSVVGSTYYDTYVVEPLAFSEIVGPDEHMRARCLQLPEAIKEG